MPNPTQSLICSDKLGRVYSDLIKSTGPRARLGSHPQRWLDAPLETEPMELVNTGSYSEVVQGTFLNWLRTSSKGILQLDEVRSQFRADDHFPRVLHRCTC